MPSAEEIKVGYANQTRRLLSNHPTERSVFDRLWGEGKLREAYVLVHQVVENSKLTMSDEQINADKDFFWMFLY